MTEFVLYREPELLDSAKHRKLRSAELVDYSPFGGLHSTLLTVPEFASAALEYLIVFVRNSEPGAATLEVVPSVILGLADAENLFVDGQRWNARYIPASIRRYPFTIAQLDGMANPTLIFDKSWRGFSETEGEPLYTSDGEPTEKLAGIIRFFEDFSGAVAKNQAFCARLVELDVLQPMTADVKLDDGTSCSLDGFYAVDPARLRALPDAVVLELVRTGMMEMLHTHLLSMGALQMLVDRKNQRLAKPA